MFTEDEYYGERFEGLVFSQERLASVRFYDCTFEKCDFGETAFKECRFSGCTFLSCNLSMIKITDSEFSQTAFRDSKLAGVNWTEAYWPRIASAGMLRFENCTISHSTFIGVGLPRSAILNCAAKNVDFREADFTEADFKGTDFSESLFGDTILSGADFSHASNYAIDPGRNRIRKAKFMLPEATSLLYHMDILLVDE